MTFRLDRTILALMAMLMISAPALAQSSNKAEDSAAQKTEEKAAAPAKVDPNFTVRMKNNKYLQGLPMEFGFIDIYILGTKVSVPLEDINGIRMGADLNAKGSIALNNGEVLNGRIDLPELKLAVDWGQAIIKRDMVKSMVRTNDMFWQMKDTPNGAMWFLAPRYYRSGSYIPSKPVNKVAPASYAVGSNDKTQAISFPKVDSKEFNFIW